MSEETEEKDPTDSDLHEWVVSVKCLLRDRNGLNHFKKFIKEHMRNSENEQKVVDAWESIHNLQKEG
jgi:hypothetical protein